MFRNDPLPASEAILNAGELHLTESHQLHEVHRGPLLLLTVFVLALLALGGWYGNRLAPFAEDDVTLDLGAMPTVEPFVVKKISAEDAIKENAAVPLTSAPVPAAKPFAFGETGSDAQRAIDCLAATAFYEAANEPIEGQMAVMQVVLNRVRHPAFPKSVCGVVFQGHERSTGCQFSYTCDGSLSRRPSESAWQRLRALAQSMLTGAVYAPVGWATHYHADYVVPYWSAKLDKVHVVGHHIFYRWAGGWGSPRAFQAGHARLEALFPKLALVSPAHRTGDPLIDGQLGLTPQLPLDAAMVAGAVALGDAEKGQYILRVDRSLDPAQLPMLAQQTCGNRPYCKVFVWADARLIPKGFPVADEQLSSMAFSYLRNVEQGFDKPLWNCAVYPRADKKECIRRRVVIEGKVEELIPVAAPDADPQPAAAKKARADGLRSLTDDDDDADAKALPEPSRTAGRRRPGEPE